MSPTDAAGDPVEALAERLLALRPALEPLPAVILAALHLGLAADSRGLARLFDTAHALVLRAAGELEDLGLAEITARDARTQRVHLRLTAGGRELAQSAAMQAILRDELPAVPDGRQRP